MTLLATHQIAHVIITSNNRESMKRVTRAAGSKPLVSVAFADADTASALSIVTARMEEAQLMDLHRRLTAKDVEKIKLLGGRASDLDAVSCLVQLVSVLCHSLISDSV